MLTKRRPRFSVLLPTRNGASYLPNCIKSVLEQDHKSFELVVSDNANTDGTTELLARYAQDAKVRVVRSERPISVVENWNKALAASSGDYVLMIGDDDCLLPGCLERLERVLSRHGDVDCVTYDAYSYFARGSFSDDDDRSYYRAGLYTFNSRWKTERTLTGDERQAVVRDMFRFVPRLPLNMQTTIVSRRQVTHIASLVDGGMFQAPFPDHYALNALLLLSESWVVVPEKLVTVGISPKSFGHFVYTHQQDAGIEYLGIDTGFDGRLPGSELTNNMFVWLHLLLRHYPERLRGMRVSRGAYVRRQVYTWFLQYKAGMLPRRALAGYLARLSMRDWVSVAGLAVDSATWVHIRRLIGGAGVDGAQTIKYGLRSLPAEVPDIGAFADWISRRGDAVDADLSVESAAAGRPQ